MTDRVNALTVVLSEDTRTDDVENLIRAILTLRNVSSVNTNVVDMTDHIARERAHHAISTAVIDALRGIR